MQLDGIDSPRGHISFTYTASSQERLKLLHVTIGSPSVGKYEMVYSDLHLPAYHAKKTDMWGYYSRIQSMNETGVYHPVDSTSVGAEILETLRYPTGGETRFEYEVLHYGKIAEQYPFTLVSENGMAGGLRVRKITDVSDDGTESVRVFHYVTESGASSGISAIKPRFSASGTQCVPFYLEGTDSLSFSISPPCEHCISYSFLGERPLNQIPRTKGSHVTYSRVEECYSDSSKIVYWYTNHDDYPDASFIMAACNYEDFGLYNSYCSHELSRGLLKRREVFSAQPLEPVTVEEYDYGRDLSDYLQGIENVTLCKGFFRRRALVWYYTYYPGLRRKRITSYSDDGVSQHIETTEYTYDSHRRMKEIKRTAGGVMERETFSYSGEYLAGPYAGMQTKHMIAYPVEHLMFRKDTLQAEKLVSAELTTWKQSDTLFVPAEKYMAALGGGVSLSVNNGSGFHPLDETGMTKDSSYGNSPEITFTSYDAGGNLILSEDRSGLPTTYIWTPDGCHLGAVCTGVRKEYTQRDSCDVTLYQQNDLVVGNFLVKDFECMAPFQMILDLACPQGQNWHLDVIIDNDSYPLTAINSSYTSSSWSASNYGQYPSYRQISIQPGSHRLRVFVRPTYYVGQSDYPTGCSLMFSYSEKQYTTVTVSGQTTLFEDFEEEGNVTSVGYCSGKSGSGVWSHPIEASGGPYVLDYRVYRNGTWNYVRQIVDSSSATINEGNAPIDHIRIFPAAAPMESYTWDTAGNLLSRTDSRGVTERYEYDALGRLTAIRDNDGNYVEQYKYNYQNK